MKRFLRYVLYREAYKWLRNIGKNDDSSSSRQLDPADGASSQQATEEIPIEERPIDSTGELQVVLQQMDPYEFEHFIADLWERQGWQAEVSAAAADEGVDVIARKDTPYEQMLLIQAKRYGPNTTVGSPDIQQYASLRHQYDSVDKVLVITTNEFTGQARKLAEQLNVKLIDGEELAELIVQQQALDLVADYIDFVTAVEPDDGTSNTTIGTQSMDAPTDETATTSGSETDARTEPLPSTIWEKAIMVAIPGWLIAFFSVTVLPEALWGVLFFTVWIGLPVAIFLDSRQVREYGEWPTRTWAYVLTSLVWLFAVVPAGLYLWRRRSVGKTDDDIESVRSRDPETAGIQEPTGSTDTQSKPHPESTAHTAPSTSSSNHDPQSTQEASSVSTSDGVNERIDIEYEGDRYYAHTTPSPAGTYTAACQDGRAGQGDPQPGRVFLLEGEDLRFTTEIARPNACAVANDGTVAVVDWNLDWGDELSGTFHVFTRGGQRLVKHKFDANLVPTAITPDGTYTATSTLNPDCSTYLFDVEAGELLVRHENQHGNVHHLEFAEQDGERILRLGEPDDDSAYGIDFGGHVIWKSDGLKRQQRLDRLLESSDEADLREVIGLLNDALERHDVTELPDLETLINLYTLCSDVQRNANEFRQEVADVLLSRLHHDRPVTGQYGSVQRTTRRDRSLKDDEAVLAVLEDAGIDRERVMGVDREKVDETLDVTELGESDVYDIDEREYVRKAEVDEEVKESRLQGLKDRLAAADDEEADELRREIEELEARIDDLTSFRTGAEIER